MKHYYSTKKGKITNLQLKKCILVKPEKTWPSIQHRGMEMKLNKVDVEGIKYFEYVHTNDYKKINNAYMMAIQTHDPNALGTFLFHNPYHAAGLLQMSNLSQMHGDFKEATNMLERAVYMYEHFFHLKFIPGDGTCRLLFEDGENFTFYKTMFRHIQCIGKKGCSRTAVELCKWVLSCDPINDPSSIACFIDYYAIRAKEYDYITQFTNNYSMLHISSRCIPSLTFSCAIAMFFKGNSEAVRPHKREILPQEDINLQKATSTTLLLRALLLFPGILKPLVTKCNAKLLNRAEWKKVVSHPYYKNGYELNQKNKYLEKLSRVFVERNFEIWKSEKTMHWLCQHAKYIIEKLDDPKTSDKTLELIGKYEKVRTTTYEAKMPEKFKLLEKCDYTDEIKTLSRDLVNQALQAPQQQQLQPGMFEIDPNANALVGFLQSLLPWYEPAQQN